MKAPSCYISVDIETAGPAPGKYALLSIGACLVEDPAIGFYVELNPGDAAIDEQAVSVSGLDLDELKEHGASPKDAMQRFAEWVEDSVPSDAHPIFVGFNAPFDWMWVADYFHSYLGHNPFGHSALDVKALFMGMTGCDWQDTGFSKVASYVGFGDVLPHHALEDARLQAQLFQSLLGRQP